MKLTDICEFHGGSQPPKSEWSSEYKDGYIRMLQIRDFTQEGRVTPEYVKISNRLRLCTEDDILIGRYGASVGKILSGKSGAYNVAIMKAVPDTSVVRKQYLRYYFLSPNFQNYILNLGGRAAQAGFSKDDLARLEITVVSLEEQDKIVNELSTLEKTISTKQKQLKEFDDLVKSRFIEMFGDPQNNNKQFPTKKLIDVVTLQRGHDLPVQNRDSHGSVPVYGSNGVLGFHTIAKCDRGIITGRSGTIGEVYVSEEPFWPLNTTLYSNNTHGNNLIYLKYLLMFFNLKRFKSGAGVPTLNRNEFHGKEIMDVPIELQNEFADFVKLIDKSKFVGYFTLNIFYVKSSHFHHPP